MQAIRSAQASEADSTPLLFSRTRCCFSWFSVLLGLEQCYRFSSLAQACASALAAQMNSPAVSTTSLMAAASSSSYNLEDGCYFIKEFFVRHIVLL
jgi:hypothetical protein